MVTANFIRKKMMVYFSLLPVVVFSQNLSFTRPSVILPGMYTDRAVDITNFKSNFFITWKEMNSGRIMYSVLGKQYGSEIAGRVMPVTSGYSGSGPKFRVIENRIYLLWISKEGDLKYIISNSDTGFNADEVYTVNFSTVVKLSGGFSAGNMGKKAMLTAHTSNKNELICCELQPGLKGEFDTAQPVIMPVQSPDYAFATGLSETTARFSWRSKKEKLVSYIDYNVETKNWLNAIPVAGARTKVSPVLYHIFGGERMFYIWRGDRNDNRLYYTTALENEQPVKQTALPVYFATDYPVAICIVDNTNFLLAFAGIDNQIYLSNFSNYNPAGWMKEILHPAGSSKTLRDIVIPGSHDAGMSTLTAAGGQQPGTINECNTLTQMMSIAHQLNSGIRMFDLRAGTYKNMLHAKHCASDCMAEAIGGGYGENLADVFRAIRDFLQVNKEEIILLSFSHFCEKETPEKDLKDSLLKIIGEEKVYAADANSIGDVPLSRLAGKVIITFETESTDKYFPSCSIAEKSAAFINFRRIYAATNDIEVLMEREKNFFLSLNNGLAKNDLVRLDWQLTQSASEAPVICNDFQDDKISPVVNGVMLLANVINKNKSIIDHSVQGNRHLPPAINEWINKGIINSINKPHIIYVDAAGEWITDYCIDLNKTALYR